MMNMAFHFNVTESPILFNWWSTSNYLDMIGSMIGIIIFAALHEGIKNYREHLFVNMSIMNQNNRGRQSQIKAMFCGIHLLQTLLHMTQITIGYFLMFIFMTYNVWLAIAVVFGTGLGYWLFAWNKCTNDNTDCCK